MNGIKEYSNSYKKGFSDAKSLYGDKIEKGDWIDCDDPDFLKNIKNPFKTKQARQSYYEGLISGIRFLNKMHRIHNGYN